MFMIVKTLKITEACHMAVLLNVMQIMWLKLENNGTHDSQCKSKSSKYHALNPCKHTCPLHVVSVDEMCVLLLQSCKKKDYSQDLKTTWIPACPSDQFSVLSLAGRWAACAFAKWQWKATCPAGKSTCPGRPLACQFSLSMYNRTAKLIKFDEFWIFDLISGNLFWILFPHFPLTF